MNHIENLEILIKAVEEQSQLDLNNYRELHTCGTLYCVAGLMPTIKHFTNMGIFPNIETGAPMRANLGDIQGTDDIAHDFFGFGWRELFATRMNGTWDQGLYTVCKDVRFTDKELALARLNKALGLAKERNKPFTKPVLV